MKNLTIKMKLALLAAVSLVSLAIVGLAGLVSVHQLSGAMNEIQIKTHAVDLIGELRINQMKSLLIMRELQDFKMESFTNSADKADLISEVQSLAKSMVERTTESDKQANVAYQEYAKIAKTPDEEAGWKNLKGNYDDIGVQYKLLNGYIHDLTSVTDATQVSALMMNFAAAMGPINSFLPKVSQDFDKQQMMIKKNSNEVKVKAETVKTSAQVLIGAALAIAFVALGIMTILIVRNVASALAALRNGMVKVAETNDFTIRMSFSGKDEIGQTAMAFDGLLDSIQGSLRAVLDSAGNISDASNNTADAAQRVSEASTRQSEAASAMAAAIEEMTVSINHISDGTREVLSRSKDASGSASEGTRVITQAADEMDHINQTVGIAGETINNVGNQSNQISTIMHVIKEVADQTNLLALNAAIEAARAGEQGRGFAVVADEVRKLAERTARSTEEIGGMIVAMQSSSKEAVGSVESIVSKVRDGKDLSVQAASHMATIQENTDQVTHAINDISSALNEQSSSAQEIARRVELVAQMSDENCRVAADTTVVANQLKGYVEALRSAANQFRI